MQECSMTPEQIEAVILELCQRRGVGRTICPSEAARALANRGEDWRSLMDSVREVGKTLSSRGRIAITQRGQVVDIAVAKGLIRFGLPQC